jgi:hypothetical protein
MDNMSIRIRNAHILEMHELEMAKSNGLLLWYPSLDATLLAPGAPVDVVDR